MHLSEIKNIYSLEKELKDMGWSNMTYEARWGEDHSKWAAGVEAYMEANADFLGPEDAYGQRRFPKEWRFVLVDNLNDLAVWAEEAQAYSPHAL